MGKEQNTELDEEKKDGVQGRKPRAAVLGLF